jgi:hypothetical protein
MTSLELMGPISVEQIVARASELLWAIATCDVEAVDAHRGVLLERLRELESQAALVGIHDLYDAVLHSCNPLIGF